LVARTQHRGGKSHVDARTIRRNGILPDASFSNVAHTRTDPAASSTISKSRQLQHIQRIRFLQWLPKNRTVNKCEVLQSVVAGELSIAAWIAQLNAATPKHRRTLQTQDLA